MPAWRRHSHVRRPRPPRAATAPDTAQNGLLAGLDWLDSLSLTGLDGQNLNEIGLKNGNLVVDDQQRGNKWTFENISLSMRRPRGGGVAVSLGEEGARPWSLKVVIGPPQNGVRSVDLRADKVPAANILLAMRVKDLTYSADLPLSGELKGELGRDGLPTYFRGKVTAGAGNLIDSDTPDYPMPIDSAEMSVEWDSGRRVLVAPFKVVSGANRITLLGHLEPPNGATTEWQAGLSGGTILLAGTDNEPPLIFNRIAIGMKFDTDRKRVLLTQADISNGEIGIAGTGSIDYANEARLQLGFAGTPMSASALKRMWPILIVPEVREWVIERIEKGTLQRIEVGVNSPVRNLSRKGPPIPDDGLAVNIVASGVTVRPVERHALGPRCGFESAGYRANGNGDDRAGHCRHAGRAQDQHFGFLVRGAGHGAEAVALAGEVQGRLPGAGGSRDPGFRPHQRSLRHADRSERQQGDGCRHHHAGHAGHRLDDQGRHHLHRDGGSGRVCRRQAGDEPEAGSQYAEAGRQQCRLSRSRATSRSTVSRPRWIIARRTRATPISGCRPRSMMPAAQRLGIDLGSAVTGAIPIKVIGKIGENDSRVGIEADLTSLRLDNILPGWVKVPGKSGKATFIVVKKEQSTLFQDIVVEGGGVSIKGSLEVDQNGDLLNANFPTYAPSDGDKTSLKAERGADGVVKVTMRGDVFDGRGFLKSAITGKESDPKSKIEEHRPRHRPQARRGRGLQRRGVAQRR